jgi:hypothetical protein
MLPPIFRDSVPKDVMMASLNDVDPRETLGRKARQIYVRDLHIDRIKVKARDFR